jgi:hypothetical protein
MEPGDEKLVTVRFILNQRPIENYLNVAGKWWIHERLSIFGEAEIVEV